MKTTCRYPILLVHGMGVRDWKHIRSWGRIPEALAPNRVWLGGQDANGSVEENAAALRERVTELLRESGAEKVNIIAHSKGGLDARYMISSLCMADSVASLTTISTPHRGSKTMDGILKLPHWLLGLGCGIADGFMRFQGDRKPKTWQAIHAFSRKSAEVFNENTPDVPGVYYQSWGFCMKSWRSDVFMWLPYLVVSAVEGQNDGLVTPASAQWGRFRGVLTGNGSRGISHCDEVDMRRRPLCRRSGSQVSDMVEFYVNLVEELAHMGF